MGQIDVQQGQALVPPPPLVFSPAHRTHPTHQTQKTSTHIHTRTQCKHHSHTPEPHMWASVTCSGGRPFRCHLKMLPPMHRAHAHTHAHTHKNNANTRAAHQSHILTWASLTCSGGRPSCRHPLNASIAVKVMATPEELCARERPLVLNSISGREMMLLLPPTRRPCASTSMASLGGRVCVILRVSLICCHPYTSTTSRHKHQRVTEHVTLEGSN